MKEPVIEIDNLTRRFGPVDAVNGLTLEVPSGSVFALLGPNGAGKTTTVKTMVSILEPSSGRARVLGVESRRLGPREFQQIGYVSENQDLPLWMTVGQLLDYCRPMYATWDAAFAAALVRQLDLPIDRKLKALSRGMRMKAALVSSLAYRPRLLILDEPFAGLDALVREEFVRGVLEVGAQSDWTVFLASHDIEEVERLADWVAIIDKGRLVLCEPVSALLARFRQVEVVVEGEPRVPDALPPEWLLPEVSGRSLRFFDTRFGEDDLRESITARVPQVSDVVVTPMSLRAVFVALARVHRMEA